MKFNYLILLFLPSFVIANNNLYDNTKEADAVFNRDEQYRKNRQEKKILKQIEQNLPQQIIADGKQFIIDDKVENLVPAIFVSINYQQWQILKGLIKKYQNIAGHDENLLLFAQANLNQSQGNYRQAITQYQIVLKKQPQFARAQLDYARALFEDFQNVEAKQQFSSLNIGQTQPIVQKNIDLYLQGITNRQQWWNYFTAGYVHNSNINQGSAKTSSDGLATGEKKEVAKGLSYEFASNKVLSVTGHHGLRFSLSGNGKIYKNNRQYNEGNYTGSVGYAYQNAKNKLFFMPEYELATVNNNKLYHSFGANMNWQHWLTPNTQMGVSYSFKDYHYAPRYQHFDGKEHLANLSLTKYFNNYAVFAGINGSQKGATSDDLKSKYYSARVGAFAEIKSIELLTIYIWKQRKFQAANLYYLTSEPRKDVENNFIVSLTVPRLSFYGIAPSLRYSFIKRKSNIDWLYSYKAHEISIRLQKTF